MAVEAVDIAALSVERTDEGVSGLLRPFMPEIGFAISMTAIAVTIAKKPIGYF
jgi:hypothetical protein